ncbi:hypothetical protein ABTY98_39260 [Streptomyces sp. NPDC096040]|uniref:hypothetical protein n=1 Tax=Streptomyces sp. NPDC096040 TaxID=3155541 RepID=UPI003329ED03
MNSPGAGGACSRGRAVTVASRSCSPVRLKKCWNNEPPQVATTLTTPAPTIVPYTPKQDASLAATTAATALPATWGTLRSIRFELPFTSSPIPVSSPEPGLSRIPEPCLPFPYLFDPLHQKGTHERNH